MTAGIPAFNPAHVSLLWARPEHAAEISALHASLFEAPWDEAAIADLLNHPGSMALVACTSNPLRMGGFALAQVAADEAEILTFGVIPEWQRRGVGSNLLSGIKRAGLKAGARHLFLDVAQSNVAALQLYQKSGFAEIGRRTGYYARPGGAEDAIQLRAAL